MACIRKFCPTLVTITKGVLNDTTVTFCIPCLAKLPPVFYAVLNYGDIAGSASTNTVQVQGPYGPIPVTTPAGTAAVLGNLPVGTTVTLAKQNVCAPNYGGITSIQIVGFNISPVANATAVNPT